MLLCFYTKFRFASTFDSKNPLWTKINEFIYGVSSQNRGC